MVCMQVALYSLQLTALGLSAVVPKERIQVFCFVRIFNPSNQLQRRTVYQTQVLLTP
ncbi:hypothetical protein ANANG_G00153290 [Anguilla anguilla]|uniref:ZP domain-containing protein n=1 Tax=Anguilla anguilla TaxID=7936 RepID=A0A9D3M716_ANGAN|nr:hypothetical protein ANANG_G00153290 [Anguilla anguilla]